MSDDLLSEDPDSRRMFDDTVKLLGCHPLDVVYNALYVSSVTAPPQGSYGKMMTVYANEVDKAIAELKRSLSRSDETTLALKSARESLAQMLDDMGESGRSVCEEAKRMGKEALTLVESALSDVPAPSTSTGWRLLEKGRPTTLAACPIGLFVNSYGGLCLKTEYGNNEGRVDAYIVESGEFFWGAHPQTIENQRDQIVQPVTILSAPGADRGWLPMESAPRDGTNILYVDRYDQIGHCRLLLNGCWLDGTRDEEVFPRCWMPALPTPPRDR